MISQRRLFTFHGVHYQEFHCGIYNNNILHLRNCSYIRFFFHNLQMTRQELYSHFEPPTSIVDHIELMVAAYRSLRDSSDRDLLKKQAHTKGMDWLTTSKGALGPRISPHTELYGMKSDYEVFKDGVDDSIQVKHMDFAMKGGFSSGDAQEMQEMVRKEMDKLREEVRRGYVAEIKQRDGKITTLEQQLSQLQKSLKAKNAEIEDRDFRLSLIENSNYDGTMIWKIPQFSQRMTDAETGKYTSIFSLPFYSSRYGYKMCLRLYIMGDGIGKGTHMSLFFVVMKGEFDNILPWPFTQRVTFRLINQKPEGRDIVDAFQPDPMSSSFKKPKSDMNIASGCPRFITHESLKNGGYIVDDTIFIKCVVDRNAIHHP